MSRPFCKDCTAGALPRLRTFSRPLAELVAQAARRSSFEPKSLGEANAEESFDDPVKGVEAGAPGGSEALDSMSRRC